jgi:hypothetical protein
MFEMLRNPEDSRATELRKIIQVKRENFGPIRAA